MASDLDASTITRPKACATDARPRRSGDGWTVANTVGGASKDNEDDADQVFLTGTALDVDDVVELREELAGVLLDAVAGRSRSIS